MTVHHMLDTPSDDEDEGSKKDVDDVKRCAADQSDACLTGLLTEQYNQRCEKELPELPDVLEISDDESECSTIRPDYIDFETGNGAFWFGGDSDGTPDLDDDFEDSDDEDDSDADEEEEDDDDRVSVGDITGIDPADEEEVYVTQPAIDDVEDDFFPCVEDRDDDHLASHSLGYIHASSGIRRVVNGSHKHEVDWALIKIRDERLAIGNTIHQHLTKSKRSRKPKGTMGPSASSAKQESVRHLTSIAPASTLPRLDVHCHGRTSGLQSGRISPALALVKLHGRTSFSSSWVVEGGGFGIPGDSGAWIYDPETGRLCGHVLAWGRQSRTAYMAPMEILFEDIRRRLGADTVELPGSEGLGTAASKQLKRLELDVLQNGMQNLCLPASGRSVVGDVEMKRGGEAPSSWCETKSIELALGSLQISDKVQAQRCESVAISTTTTSKDVPKSLARQAQGCQQGLQKVLQERVLGSRVA